VSNISPIFMTENMFTSNKKSMKIPNGVMRIRK